MISRYITGLYLSKSLSLETLELINYLVKLSYSDEVLLRNACVKFNLLEENFIPEDRIPWEELVNDFLITLTNHSKSNGVDTTEFPSRLILINDFISKKEITNIDSQLKQTSELLNQIIYPYITPRFIFWHINSLSEFSKLNNCDFVGGKSKSLIEVVSQSKYNYISEFINKLQDFRIDILPPPT